MFIVIVPPFLAPCKGCPLGKMHDHPDAPLDKQATRPLALVHTDMVGPMPVEPCLWSHYILIFIDDFFGYALVAFICTKDGVPQHFHSMVSWAETFTGHLLTSVCSDWGGEFLDWDLQSFFSSRGITHQTSIPHTPQQNGHAERFNHTLLEKAEAMQQHACLPNSGKMLLRLHCTFIIANQCIVIIGKHPLRYSVEINLTFPTLEYLGLMLMTLSHKSSNMTSCLLKQRRWSLLDMNQTPRAITSGHNNADKFSFPLMLYLTRLSSHAVPKVKKTDLPLFHFKKNYWQHLMTSKNLNLIHRIWNLIEIFIFSYQ